MNRKIKAPNTIDYRVKVVCYVMGYELSEGELKALVGLIERCENNGLFLSVNVSSDLRGKKDLSDSGLSTALHRLKKKKLIVTKGKTISLHPAFNGIQELENLVIDFTGL